MVDRKLEKVNSERPQIHDGHDHCVESQVKYNTSAFLQSTGWVQGVYCDYLVYCDPQF